MNVRRERDGGADAATGAAARRATPPDPAAVAAQALADAQARLVELEAAVRHFGDLLQQLAQPLRALDDEVERELFELALAIGAQLARRELRVDPGQIVAIVRECLEQLPLAARDLRVHLHPDDAATLRARLAMPASERAWTLVDDPTLTRGGCLVRSTNSQIDARFESRVRALVATALGEERSADRQALADTPSDEEPPR